ncbi:MAG: GGDEF domain-containing protein [Isosphaeraceae bacterium]
MDELSATFIGDLPPAAENPPRAESPARPLYFIVVRGRLPGAMIRLRPGPTTIGRAGDNVLQIADNTVSRHHARLDFRPDGSVRLIDFGSTNGTLVNDRKVEAAGPIALNDGDHVQFGHGFVVKLSRPTPREERYQLEMFERVVRDPLTGLHNRAFLLDRVHTLANLASRRGLGLAVLMVDIDHFKQINDTFGHHAGDGVLRQVAAEIQRITRQDDLVARFGGEEFVIALPMPGVQQVIDRADRMRTTVADKEIPIGERHVRVTVSIGLAYAKADAIRPFHLVAAADQNLYRAKQAGRNRVIAGSGSDAQLDLDLLTQEESAWCLPVLSSPESAR